MFNKHSLNKGGVNAHTHMSALADHADMALGDALFWKTQVLGQETSVPSSSGVLWPLSRVENPVSWGLEHELSKVKASRNDRMGLLRSISHWEARLSSAARSGPGPRACRLELGLPASRAGLGGLFRTMRLQKDHLHMMKAILRKVRCAVCGCADVWVCGCTV